MKMILVKIHQGADREVIALCDSDLIGKDFEDGELILEVTERFYKGEPMEEQMIIGLLKNADNLNIIGKESVELALKAKVINEHAIRTIQGIPHAQVYSM